jgi:hypothetical protein
MAIMGVFLTVVRTAAAQIPILNSYTTASKKIFLDFRGTTSAPPNWKAQYSLDPDAVFEYSNAQPIPAFDSTKYSWIGGNQTQIITDIWKMFGDRYSMFNVNVTTVPPSAQDEAANNFIRVLFDDDPEGWILESSSQDKGKSMRQTLSLVRHEALSI